MCAVLCQAQELIMEQQAKSHCNFSYLPCHILSNKAKGKAH